MSIVQFMGIFRNVLRLNLNRQMTIGEYQDLNLAQSMEPKSLTSKKVTPYDLEQSILRPQFDPLVGELVTRLLQKNKWKLKAGDNVGKHGAVDEEEDKTQLSYEQWNENLAKKFNVLFKSYQKFKLRFLKDSP